MPTRLRTGLDRARDLRDDAERHGRASACRRYRSASFSRDGHERRKQLAGVVVNRHPNLARDECDVLKAILTNCIRHGPASQNRAAHPDFRAYLAGRVAHARALNAARCMRCSPGSRGTGAASARKSPRRRRCARAGKAPGAPDRKSPQTRGIGTAIIRAMLPRPCKGAAPGGEEVATKAARRAFERDAPRVACRCHAAFDDGVACGILRKPCRSGQTIHTSQHRLAELRDRFGHRRFFE